jgi:hypothetical protein
MADLAVHVEKWMADAKLVAVGNHQQVLENGDEFCSSDSDSEGIGQNDSESLGKISEGRHQTSQEQVHAWHMSRNGGPQLHSESQVSAQSAAADTRASGSMGSTTQARPREKGYVCGTTSPFPDLGTTAGSCEPTIQPPTTASGALASLNSDDGRGMSQETKRSPTPVGRKSSHKRQGRWPSYRCTS